MDWMANNNRLVLGIPITTGIVFTWFSASPFKSLTSNKIVFTKLLIKKKKNIHNSMAKFPPTHVAGRNVTIIVQLRATRRLFTTNTSFKRGMPNTENILAL